MADLVEFGHRVRDRRQRLGLRQNAVPGGPSSTYLSQIERGVHEDFTADTVRKLADGLQWDAGHVQAVLDGEVPVDFLPISSGGQDALAKRGATGSAKRWLDELIRDSVERLQRLTFEKVMEEAKLRELLLSKAGELLPTGSPESEVRRRAAALADEYGTYVPNMVPTGGEENGSAASTSEAADEEDLPVRGVSISDEVSPEPPHEV